MIPADLAAEPFPDIATEDLLLAYAALCGWLSAAVPAEFYADGIMRARKAVADRKATPARPEMVDVPLLGKTGPR